MTDPAQTPDPGKPVVQKTDGLFVIGVALVVLGLLGVARVPFLIVGVLFIVMGGGLRLRPIGKDKA